MDTINLSDQIMILCSHKNKAINTNSKFNKQLTSVILINHIYNNLGCLALQIQHNSFSLCRNQQ